MDKLFEETVKRYEKISEELSEMKKDVKDISDRTAIYWRTFCYVNFVAIPLFTWKIRKWCVNSVWKNAN